MKSGYLKVQGNVYMLVGPAGNIAAQMGDDGIVVVNTGTEAMAPKVAAALRTLSDKPITVGGEHRRRSGPHWR